MSEIKKKDIRKWVKALRSGEFKQAKGALQDKVGYCCLEIADCLEAVYIHEVL